MPKALKYGVFFLTIICLIALFSAAALGVFFAISPVSEAWNIIHEDYVNQDEVNDWDLAWGAIGGTFAAIFGAETLTQGAIEGMLDTLSDPFTSYLTAAEYQYLYQQLQGDYVGIGVSVTKEEGGPVTVVHVFAGSPADEGGLEPGDKILEIDNEYTLQMSAEEVADRLRGVEGTKVRLTVQHLGGTTEYMEITRAVIGTVGWKMLDNNIAYIELRQFGENTGAELIDTLSDVFREHPEPDGIILDLRNNSGGYLDESVTVASQFLDEGDIILSAVDSHGVEMIWSIKSVEGNEIILSEADSQGNERIWTVERVGEVTDLPLAVLVNSGSASASEVVAAALQDYGRAPLIGTETLGKGDINHLEPLSDGSAIYICFAHWYSPLDTYLTLGNRLIPNYYVEDEDAQLETAIAYIDEEAQLEAAIAYIIDSGVA